MTQKFYKFKAETLDDALNAMRKRLGNDAIVVRTATVIEGGILGVFGRKLVELTVAAPVATPLPRTLSAVERKYKAASNNDFAGANPPKTPAQESTVAYFEKLVSDAQRRMDGAPPASEGGGRAYPRAEGTAALDSRPQAPPLDETLHKNILEMREMLQVISAEMPGPGLPTEFVPHYHMLLDRGIERNVAAKLLTEVVKNVDTASLKDPRVFRERLKIQIRKAIDITGGIVLRAGRCQVVALVGATGVGKTTNLAKLAALFAVRERANVGLITTDTYRVAATDQLRTYANIIGLDFYVAHDRKEMAQATQALNDHDLVLIDTAGGSPFNAEQIEETRAMLDVAQPGDVMLVLSAATPVEDMRNAVTRFSVLKPTSLLFTKLDETRRFGSPFCLAAETRLPLSYFSTGQNVPDDAVLAHPGMVADLVMEGGDRRGRTSAKSS